MDREWDESSYKVEEWLKDKEYVQFIKDTIGETVANIIGLSTKDNDLIDDALNAIDYIIDYINVLITNYSVKITYE